MKNLTLKAVIFCLAILSIALFIRLQQSKKEEVTNRAYHATKDSIVLEEAKEISRTVNQQGIESVTFKDVPTIDVNYAKDLPVAGFIDTTAKAIGIKNSQIKELMQIKSSLSAENLKLRRELDENKQEVYYYKDKYLSIAYKPAKHKSETSSTDTSVTEDHGTIDFKYDAELNIVRYNKRSRFLAPKKNYIDVFSTDPRVTIGGLKSFRIEESPKTTGFDLQATSQYNFKDKSFGIGPGVSIDLKKFNFQGKYLMALSTRERTWIATGSYSILKL